MNVDGWKTRSGRGGDLKDSTMKQEKYETQKSTIKEP